MNPWSGLSLSIGIGVFAFAFGQGTGFLMSIIYGLFWEVWAGYRFASWLWTH